MADFLSVADLDPEALASILDTAARIKTDPGLVSAALKGLQVGLFFEKPSARTRVSTEVGCNQLGAHPVVLRGEEVGLGSREAVEDVARVFDRYLDVLAFRVYHHSDLETLAEYAAAPVINLLSDVEHPCQALADLQTLAEHRPLPGATLAYIGDGNNVCHSLVLAAAMTRVTLRIATPPGFEPSAAVIAAARRLGGDITLTHSAAEAALAADAVYTDVWASMGQENEAEDRRRSFAAMTVDGGVFATAADDAVFLHCLPAHRGEEVTDDVVEHPRSVVFDQAENRLHSFKALLLHLAG